MGKYDDIINMDRPVSKKHSPMPIENRAPQFAPFAALTGYDDAVEETARLTDRKIEISEEERELLDETINEILSKKDINQTISAEYFVKDKVKEGGEYVCKTGLLKKVDAIEKTITWQDGTVVSIEDVIEIRIVQSTGD